MYSSEKEENFVFYLVKNSQWKDSLRLPPYSIHLFIFNSLLTVKGNSGESLLKKQSAFVMNHLSQPGFNGFLSWEKKKKKTEWDISR